MEEHSVYTMFILSAVHYSQFRTRGDILSAIKCHIKRSTVVMRSPLAVMCMRRSYKQVVSSRLPLTTMGETSEILFVYTLYVSLLC